MNIWDTLRKVGAVLIAVAMVLMWQNLYWPALLTLIAIGGIDIALAIKKEDTISNLIHGLFSQKIDYVVMVGVIAFTWYIWGVEGFLPVMMGIIVGHLFWHED